MSKVKSIVVVAAVAVAALAGVSVSVFAYAQTLYVEEPATTSVVVPLDCPQEDSCDVDYRDGAWHVTQVTP